MQKTIIATLIWTTLALLAFAGNSVLCRMALGEQAIDANSFTAIRLLSGIITLVLILSVVKSAGSNTQSTAAKGSWLAALMLFIYALTFSYAYLTLDTGTGALILFGAVQITMILISVIKGQKLHQSEWLGVALAFSGFVYLVLPSLSTPSLSGFILMSLSGIAWGIYTLKGQGSLNPLSDTAYNFLRTLPLISAVLLLILLQGSEITGRGALLAILSGSLASGVGYTLWYTALKGLTGTQAAVVQLSVPVIAAAGGILFSQEQIDLRLVISAVMVLGGILMVVLGKRYLKPRQAGN